MAQVTMDTQDTAGMNSICMPMLTVQRTIRSTGDRRSISDADDGESLKELCIDYSSSSSSVSFGYTQDNGKDGQKMNKNKN